jgi:hypothetical protein
MSTAIEQIESAILKLSPQELAQLTNWVLDLDEQQWDQQIENDVVAGKPDFLTQEALGKAVFSLNVRSF